MLLQDHADRSSDDEANILAAHEELRGTIELGTIGGAVGRGRRRHAGRRARPAATCRCSDIMVHRDQDADHRHRRSDRRRSSMRCSRAPSRVSPCGRTRPENIVGVLHTKELLVALARERLGPLPRSTWQHGGAAPWFVPDTHQRRRSAQRVPEAQGAASPSWSTSTARCRASSPSRTSWRRSSARSPTSTTSHRGAVRVQADGSVNVDGTVAVRDLNRRWTGTCPTRRPPPSPASSSTRRRRFRKRARCSPSTATASRFCARAATASRGAPRIKPVADTTDATAPHATAGRTAVPRQHELHLALQQQGLAALLQRRRPGSDRPDAGVRTSSRAASARHEE